MNQAGRGSGIWAIISSIGVISFTTPANRKTSASSPCTIHNAYRMISLLRGASAPSPLYPGALPLRAPRSLTPRGRPCLVPRRDLLAQALLLLAQLGRELGAEILRLEHLPDLDLRLPLKRIGAAPDPLDGLLLRL